MAGLSVAVAALVARQGLTSLAAWRASGPALRRFYEGGFQPVMDRREAALILGCRRGGAQRSGRALGGRRSTFRSDAARSGRAQRRRWCGTPTGA